MKKKKKLKFIKNGEKDKVFEGNWQILKMDKEDPTTENRIF